MSCLLALHAQERNAHILKSDPDNVKGSGITDEEAQKNSCRRI